MCKWNLPFGLVPQKCTLVNGQSLNPSFDISSRLVVKSWVKSPTNTIVIQNHILYFWYWYLAVHFLRKFNTYHITFWWLKYNLKSSSFICINCGMHLDVFQKLYFYAIYVNRYCKYISTVNYRRLSKIQMKLEIRSSKHANHD